MISQGPTESGQQFGSSHLRLPQEAYMFVFFWRSWTIRQMPYRLPYECHTLPYTFTMHLFLNILEPECHTQCHTMRMPYQEIAIPYAIRIWKECHTYGILRYGILRVWHGVWHCMALGVWLVQFEVCMYGIQGYRSTWLDFRFCLMRQTFTELKRTILDRSVPIKTQCRPDYLFFFSHLKYNI